MDGNFTDRNCFVLKTQDISMLKADIFSHNKKVLNDSLVEFTERMLKAEKFSKNKEVLTEQFRRG
jgi:hypothetical protein